MVKWFFNSFSFRENNLIVWLYIVNFIVSFVWFLMWFHLIMNLKVFEVFNSSAVISAIAFGAFVMNSRRLIPACANMLLLVRYFSIASSGDSQNTLSTYVLREISCESSVPYSDKWLLQMPLGRSEKFGGYWLRAASKYFITKKVVKLADNNGILYRFFHI